MKDVLAILSYVNLTTVYVLDQLAFGYHSALTWVLDAMARLFSLFLGHPTTTMGKVTSTVQACPENAIWITGCSTGIGHDAAIYFARLGFTVYAGVRRGVDGERLISDYEGKEGKPGHVFDPNGGKGGLTGRLVPVLCDVTKEEEVNETMALIRRGHLLNGGKLVAVVNNAGIQV